MKWSVTVRDITIGVIVGAVAGLVVGLLLSQAQIMRNPFWLMAVGIGAGAAVAPVIASARGGRERGGQAPSSSS